MELERPDTLVPHNVLSDVYKICNNGGNGGNKSYNKCFEERLKKHGYSIISMAKAKKLNMVDKMGKHEFCQAPSPNEEDYKFPYPGIIVPTYLLG